jgi:hypothetical protein
VRNGGTTAAEIALWVAAAGAGTAAVVVEGAGSRTSLVVIATFLALVPIPIEFFRRHRVENSAEARRARDLADEAWNATIGSPDPADEPSNSTMRSRED